MRVVVTPGNHEDYHQISELSAQNRDQHPAHAGFEALGAVMWSRDRIALLPRGHRFTRSGWSFVSLGGAPSVDFEHRITGQSWWIEEMITDDDVATVVAGGPADVMLTHDSPEPWHGTDMVAKIVQTPLGRSAEVLAYAAEGRRRLDEAFQAVKPRVLAHGHYHVKDSKRIQIDGCDHQTLVVATECDQMPDANLGLLHLPDEQTEGTSPGGMGAATTDHHRGGPQPARSLAGETRLGLGDRGVPAGLRRGPLGSLEPAHRRSRRGTHRRLGAPHGRSLKQSKNPRAGEFMGARAGGLLPDSGIEGDDQ